jgi:hypothetical protein
MAHISSSSLGFFILRQRFLDEREERDLNDKHPLRSQAALPHHDSEAKEAFADDDL